MAEISITDTAEILKKLKEWLDNKGKAEEFFKSLVDSGKYTFSAISGFIEKSNESLKKLGINTKDVQKFITSSGQSIADLFKDPLGHLNKLGVEIGDIKDHMLDAAGNTKNLNTALFGTGLVVSGLVSVSAGMKGIGDKAKDSTIQVTDFSGEMSKLKALGGKILPGFEKVLEGAEKFATASQHAKNLENALMRNAAAAGTFDEMMGSMGNNFEGLDSLMLKFHSEMRNIGDATGLSSDKVAEYYTSLQAIPGALEENIKTGKDANISMKMLDATIMVARGTMRDTSAVISDLNVIYQKLGFSGQEALEVISRMTDVTNKLTIPFDKVQKVVHGAATDFRFFGKAVGSVNNNLDGAINILAKMGPALKNYGLGPDAIQEIVSGITKGVADLDMAQKAFLSAQTGGAGGMKGAFEIDLMLREGDVEGVFNKVRDSLMQQFGGRIVTLEEAAKSEDAAAQMAKQIQILTSGPLKMAGGAEQAKAIIEAMAAGDTSAVIQEGQESLDNTIKKGNDIRDRQYSAITAIHNEVKEITNQATISARFLESITIGATKGTTEMKAFLADTMSRGRSVASKSGANIKNATDIGTAVDNTAIGAAMNAAEDLFYKGMELFKKPKTMVEKGTETKEQTRERAAPRGREIPEEGLRGVLPSIPPRGEGFSKEQQKSWIDALKTPLTPVTPPTLPRSPEEPVTAAVSGTLPGKQTYTIDVVCTGCSEKQFSKKISGINTKIEDLYARAPSQTGSVIS